MTTPPEALPRHILERKLRRSRTLNLILGTLAAVGLVFGGAQLANGGGFGSGGFGGDGSAAANQSAPGSETSAASTKSLERRIDGDPMAIGALDAPVVMSEWIDFRCPFCAVHSRDTMPQLVREYVESGKVRIEIHDVAFFGEQSERAAVAARAAGEQGKYFEFVSAVYDAAPEGGHPELPAEELIAFAKQVGVADLDRFEQDMQREDLYAAVRASTQTAQQLGVSGVPFFAIGTQAMSGAQPIESFRQFINPLL